MIFTLSVFMIFGSVSPIFAAVDTEDELESNIITISIDADQWEGVTERYTLDDGSILEISISDVQDVAQPRSTEELGVGTWTRTISATRTLSPTKTLHFAYTFKVKVSATEYAKFTTAPYNIVRTNCTNTVMPSVSVWQATSTTPAKMSGSANGSMGTGQIVQVTLTVTVDKNDILTLTVKDNLQQ